mmetsp:Transcript_62457/g.122904  ORF Transcript_62457/g.122904 Transcript_62457/m.122904 type:complete len:418 (+) Transcript_62457:176-1429(+)
MSTHALDQRPHLRLRLLDGHFLAVCLQEVLCRPELAHTDGIALLQTSHEFLEGHRTRPGKGFVHEEVEVLLSLGAHVLRVLGDALLKRQHRSDEADRTGNEGGVRNVPVRAHLSLADDRIDLHSGQAQHGLVEQVAHILHEQCAQHLGVLSLEQINQVLRELIVLEFSFQQVQRGELLQQIEGEGHELAVGNLAILVMVDLKHDRVDLAPRQPELHGHQCLDEFRLAQCAAVVCVHALEDGTHELRELLARHAVHQQVLGMLLDVEHVLLQSLLRVHALDDLHRQRDELLVLDLTVRVHVGLGQKSEGFILGEVEALLEVRHEALELLAIQVPVAVVVVLGEQFLDDGLHLIKRHARVLRAILAAVSVRRQAIGQAVEILGRELVDVRWLVPKHFACKVLQDVRKLRRDLELLRELA